MNSQELELFVNNDFRLVKRNLKTGIYGVNQAVGHLNCLKNLTEANSRRDLIGTVVEELSILTSPGFSTMIQPVTMETPVIIKQPDQIQLKEIIRLGGEEIEHNYVVMFSNTVLGYFWGNINEEILLGPVGVPLKLSSDEMFLEFMYVPVKENGTGRRIIKGIFEELSISKIYAETSNQNKGFWERVGADIDPEYSDDFREMNNLTLTKEQFYKSILQPI